MKRPRTKRNMYAKGYMPPRKRYGKRGFGAFLRRAGRVLAVAGAVVVHALVAPFAALGMLFVGKRHDRPIFVAAAEAADGAAVPIVAPARAAGLPLRRVVDISLVLAMAAAGLYLGWSLAYSDTSKWVTFERGGTAQRICTDARTVEQFLALSGYTPGVQDTLNVEKTAPIVNGMEITVFRPFPVSVASGGNVQILHMRGGTVDDALKLAGVAYDADDELTRLPFEDVAPGMQIQHIGVEFKYETADETVEFREKIEKDPERYKGEDYAKITTKGENGERRTVRRLIYKDGALFSREIMNQVTLKPAVEQVKVVGTKIRYQTSFVGETREWRPKPTKDEIKETMVAIEVTAYTHTGRRTATGRHPRIGFVAVNPNVIPYGTKLYVPGYGYCVAQDTGAFRHEDSGNKNQLDLFLNTEEECIKWGRKRNVKFYILK